MSESPAQEFRRVAGRFGDVVDGVRPDQWDDPSPVQEWTARDVVGHLVGWFPAFLADGAGIGLRPGPSVNDDPAGAWRHLYGEVLALLEDPASADLVLRNPHIGELPVPRATSQFFTGDVFQHTWDLARATGQDDSLDPEVCAAMLEGMVPIEDLMRQSGQYGPRVEVPDDADVQTRFIAFIGRDPDWTRDPSAV
jgi:uncharacterized protein (TIGR03086 family)